jgi:hypothetical protein
VIGGWNNTRPALRRLGREVRALSFLPPLPPLPPEHPASASPAEYRPFWLSLDAAAGVLAVGTGVTPGEGTFLSYRDAEPLPGVTRVGLSCWRHPVSFAGVAVGPSPQLASP